MAALTVLRLDRSSPLVLAVTSVLQRLYGEFCLLFVAKNILDCLLERSGAILQFPDEECFGSHPRGQD